MRLSRLLALLGAATFAPWAAAEEMTLAVVGFGSLTYNSSTGEIAAIMASFVIGGLLLFFVVFMGVALTRWAFLQVQQKAAETDLAVHRSVVESSSYSGFRESSEEDIWNHRAAVGSWQPDDKKRHVGN